MHIARKPIMRAWSFCICACECAYGSSDLPCEPRIRVRVRYSSRTPALALANRANGEPSKRLQTAQDPNSRGGARGAFETDSGLQGGAFLVWYLSYDYVRYGTVTLFVTTFAPGRQHVLAEMYGEQRHATCKRCKQAYFVSLPTLLVTLAPRPQKCRCGYCHSWRKLNASKLAIFGTSTKYRPASLEEFGG
eukprot:scaffold38031_cov44-Prasinocladus_malaysianus.AAC.2